MRAHTSKKDVFSIWKSSRVASVIVSLLIASGCTDLEYSVSSANYTNHGIVIMDFPITGAADEERTRFRIGPGVPGIASDVGWLGNFSEYPHSLPDALVIKWKKASIINCKDVDKVNPKVNKYFKRYEFSRPLRKFYIRRRGCDWSIDDSKVYTKKLDIEAIRQSEEYANATGIKNPLGANPTLKIELLFWAPDDLQVRLRNGRTMAFME